ncbi:MAG TPA: class I SAM-dependent methyltransferase, partial [Elusimicrobiales bacterium]|nr:class I SAM-dependent methyltransferase [Elusimicrobiales bacterium]
ELSFAERTAFSPEGLRGKTVLDAGCGMGRYLEIAARSAGEVVGADLSLAVDSAYDNVGKLPNVHIVQADIMRLPFKPGVFDAAYSLGVLHHTPDTKKAFLSLVPLLKKGALASIWVYSKEDAYMRLSHRFSDFYRIFTSRLPKKLLWQLSRLSVPLYYLKKIKKLHTLLDVVLPMSNHPEPQWRVLDTFDWYSPRYQHKHTYAEVDAWFKEAGFEEVRNLTFPVSVTGVKQ